MSRPMPYSLIFGPLAVAGTLAMVVASGAQVNGVSTDSNSDTIPLPADASITAYNCFDVDGKSTCLTEYTRAAKPDRIFLAWDGGIYGANTDIPASGSLRGNFQVHTARISATQKPYNDQLATLTPASDSATTCEIAEHILHQANFLICKRSGR